MGHIRINRKFRSSLLDVRVTGRADNAGSDHLLAAKVQLKMKRCNNPSNYRATLNIQLFQYIGTTELYQTSLQNSFKALQKKNLVVHRNTEKSKREKGKKDILKKCKTRATKTVGYRDGGNKQGEEKCYMRQTELHWSFVKQTEQQGKKTKPSGALNDLQKTIRKF